MNDFLFKIFRSDNTFRAFNFWFGMGLLSILGYVKASFTAAENPQEIKEKLERERSKS
jgi:hypothetical protein